ncbi:6387_t:CDS:1 [Acaulospora morrowiae]|uniref:6387_t:CDS:1 n=1 Tax=Acaulospora morrowiae TaxID=94023 RepID=A0A9N9CCB8_9GLOM|nr:6387_t:CDS:1 [Acaulospora morrowiae]
MNRQTFNIFLIVLAISLALTITVDASSKKCVKKPTKPKCISICCLSLGSPGWTNKVHDTSSYTPNINATTAQDCCDSCVDDPECLEWIFGTESGCNRIYNSNPLEDVCLSIMTVPSGILDPDSQGGVIRCSNSNECT